MIIRGAKDIRPSEITPYGVYLNRRQFIGAGTALSLGSLFARTAHADLSMDAKPTPWTLKVDGLVAKPADYALDDFIKPPMSAFGGKADIANSRPHVRF